MKKDALKKGQKLEGQIELLIERIDLFNNVGTGGLRLDLGTHAIKLEPDDPVFIGVRALAIGHYSDQLRKAKKEFDEL